VEDAERAEVYTLAVTTTPRAWPRNREVTQPTRYVRAALGLHPQMLSERANEVFLWDEYFPQAQFIGEVGIDAGPRWYRSLDLQKEVFQHVLQQCAKSRDKILTIHSARAATVVLDLIERHFPVGGRSVVLHWFTGSISEARRAVELGCYFSINSQMLASNKGRTLVVSLPADRILTETDGPFTTINSSVASPAGVYYTVEGIAKVRTEATHEVKLNIRHNLRTLLKKQDL
jgi:TatD DNase family protein